MTRHDPNNRLDAEGRLRVTRLGDVTQADLELVGSRHDLPPQERWRWMFALLETRRAFPHHATQVSQYQHGLQTATRALRAGESDELIIAALFHDAFDELAMWHADAAAALLEGYVSPDIHWMVRHHAIFQEQHKQRADHQARRQAYRQFAGHPAFELTRRFCADYDEPAFDFNYDTLPLAAFGGLAVAVFAAPRYADV